MLICICLCVSLALAVTNALTANRIKELEEQAEQDALRTVIPDCEYTEGQNGDISYYIASSGDEIKGYIFVVTGKGYGGDITVMTAVKDATVLGVAIVDVSSETTGLGQRAEEPEFYGQFTGLTEGIGVNKNVPGSNEIKAITGATITSKAVTEAVNTALGYAKEIEGGANGGEQ